MLGVIKMMMRYVTSEWRRENDASREKLQTVLWWSRREKEARRCQGRWTRSQKLWLGWMDGWGIPLIRQQHPLLCYSLNQQGDLEMGNSRPEQGKRLGQGFLVWLEPKRVAQWESRVSKARQWHFCLIFVLCDDDNDEGSDPTNSLKRGFFVRKSSNWGPN